MVRLGPFGLIVLLALGLDQARRSAASRLDERIVELVGRGKPTELGDVLRPQIAEDRNAAVLIERDAEPWTAPMKRFEARLAAGELEEGARQFLYASYGGHIEEAYSGNAAMSAVIEDPATATDEEWLVGELLLEALGPELALLERIAERPDWRFSDPLVFSGTDHLRRALSLQHSAGVEVEPWLSYAAVWTRFALLAAARDGDVERAIELGGAASQLLRATDSQPWVAAWTVGAAHRFALWETYEHVADLAHDDADLTALVLEVERAPIEFDWTARFDAHRALHSQTGFLDPLLLPHDAGIEIAGELSPFQESTTRVFDGAHFLEIGLELEAALTLGAKARRRRVDEVLSQDSSWLHPTAVERWDWPPIETLETDLRTTRERVLKRLRRLASTRPQPFSSPRPCASLLARARSCRSRSRSAGSPRSAESSRP